jgi:broad specificity phosphatase PhoE
MDWQAIRYLDSEAHSKFMSNPVDHGYPGGENFHQVSERVTAAIEQLFQMYRGKTLLVVSHHVVNRVFLSTLIGLPLEQARHVSLDNCGISVVVRNGYETVVETLNAGKHLEDIAA